MKKLENHKGQISIRSLFCLNKLKVRTQVLIIQVIIQFLIGTLLTLISYLAFQYIIDMYNKLLFHILSYSNISLEFYVLQYYKKTDMITNLQVRSSQEVLLRSQSHLLKSDFLYQFIQTVELQYVQQPLNCLNYDDKFDKYQYEQTFCYGFFGDSTYPLIEFINFIKLYKQRFVGTQLFFFFNLSLTNNGYGIRFTIFYNW